MLYEVITRVGSDSDNSSGGTGAGGGGRQGVGGPAENGCPAVRQRLQGVVRGAGEYVPADRNNFV